MIDVDYFMVCGAIWWLVRVTHTLQLQTVFLGNLSNFQGDQKEDLKKDIQTSKQLPSIIIFFIIIEEHRDVEMSGITK